MTEVDSRIATLERRLVELRAQLDDQARRARSARWVIGALVVLAVNLSLSTKVLTQAQLPPPPKAMTRIDVPVAFFDGGRQVAEFRSGGLIINGLLGGPAFKIGVDNANQPTFQVYSGGKMLLRMDHAGLTVYSVTGAPAAAFGAIKSGAGYMGLSNPTGGVLVEAGVMDDMKRGVVRVYPQGGPPPMVIPKTLIGGSPK